MKKVLVLSAHAVDFLWRCGGTIARYAQAGHEVKIIDFTFGARGESDQVWKENPSTTEQAVRERRRAEATAAAKILGASISFYEWEDHLLDIDRAGVMRIAADIKDFHPDIILTHTEDPLNMDHTVANHAVIAALRSAQVYGVYPEKPVVTTTNIYMFEPDQPELAGFNPDFFVDITDVMDLKIKAMEAITSQQHLLKNYTNRAEYRSYLAKRLACDPGIKYAEAFVRFMPQVGKFFND